MWQKTKPAAVRRGSLVLEEWKGITGSFASPKTAARKRTLAFAWPDTCSEERNSYSDEDYLKGKALSSAGG